MIPPSEVVHRTEHHSIPTTLKNILNKISELIGVLFDERVVLRVGTLLLTPVVVRMVCQYETHRTFEWFNRFVLRVCGVPEVVLTIETDFSHFFFLQIPCACFISSFNASAPVSSALMRKSTSSSSLIYDVTVETVLVDSVTSSQFSPSSKIFTTTFLSCLPDVVVIVLLLEGPEASLLRESEPYMREAYYIVVEMSVTCPKRDEWASSILMISKGGGTGSSMLTVLINAVFMSEKTKGSTLEWAARWRDRVGGKLTRAVSYSV